MTEEKKKNGASVPLIDLSPKLKRPLSLWNPLDYLRLLSWAFFFPQAIRWYVETFCKEGFRHRYEFENYKEFRKAVSDDPSAKNLILQALVIVLLFTPGICFILSKFNVPVNWSAVVAGVVYGLALGLFGFVRVWVAVGVAVGVAGGVAVGVAVGAAGGVAGGVGVGAAGSVAGGVAVGVVGGVVGGIGGVISNFILPIVIIIRMPEYLMMSLYLTFFPTRKKIKCLPFLSRIIVLQLPGIQKNLKAQLETGWENGVQTANQLLKYSLQFVPVIKAIQSELGHSSPDVILSRVSTLTFNLFDWKLLPALSEKPVHLYWRKNLTPRLDTPANAACAGFWFWHFEDYIMAVDAFSHVLDFRHGLELHNIALTIEKGIQTEDMQAVAAVEAELNWIDSLPDPELRTGTLRALRIFRNVVKEAGEALNARAPLNRSTAINRAAADLITLIDTGKEFCPDPEWPLIKKIAEKWKEIITRAGGAIGEEVLRQPVLNPYDGYSGLPVTGSSFTGRTGVMRQIETHWAVAGPMPALILFGHRRMGKTSVLRNLSKNTGPHNLYVYLDMQNAGWVEHTGILLLDFAEAVHKAASALGPGVGPVPDPGDYTGLDAARRSFNDLLRRIDSQMPETGRLVLAIDEFELIEKGIEDERIDPGLLSYLRSVNQQYSWLGLVFAGLHTLDEMGRDYRSAFYGQAQYIRLGYLSREDTLHLIAQPHPDFALEYDDALIDEIYRLTFGQPYLVQRICWELVNRWNDRFLEQGETTPRTLPMDDLAPVLTPDFYQGAGYYFEGVWSNATENEQRLMRIIATYENNPLSRQQAAAEAVKTGFPDEPETIEETFDLLLRHDIITETETGIRFASELMRRWVDTKQETKY